MEDIGRKPVKQRLREEQEKARIERQEFLRMRAASVDKVKVVYKESAPDVIRRAPAREVSLPSPEYRLQRREAFLDIVKGAAKAGRKRGVYRTHTVALDAASKRLGQETYEDLLLWLDRGLPDDWKWDEAKAFRDEIMEVSFSGYD